MQLYATNKKFCKTKANTSMKFFFFTWKCDIYVIYQTIAQLFGHISKHREQKLKNEAQLSFLTKVQGVWKFDSLIMASLKG